MKNPTGLPFLGVLLFALTVFVGGCGSPPPPPAPTYSVGGTLSGLASGEQLVLQNNQTDDLTLSADGPFTFAAKLADGAAYSVTVKTPPQGQTCTVTNGSGTLSGADVSNVQVSCSAAPGTLDASFGTDGVVTYDSGGYDAARAVTFDSSGRLLVAGYSTPNADYDMTLWRYDAGGSVDGSFGTNGVATYDGGNNSYAYALTLDASGNILVAGEINGTNGDMALWRYDASGAPDNTFGSDPGTNLVAYTDGQSSSASAIAVDASGRILVAGYIYSGSYYRMALWRYDENGGPDNTFGGNSLTNFVTYGGGTSFGKGMVLAASGKILVAGYLNNGSNDDMALWRYNSDGSPDNTFGSDGSTNVVVYDGGSSDYAQAIALDSSGKILIAGFMHKGAAGYDMGVLRYGSDGAPDNTFGSDSGTNIVTYDGGSSDQAYAVAVDSSNRVLVAGSISQNSGLDAALWRFDADGQPDGAFGTNGVATYNGGNSDYAYALALDSSGRVLMAGSSFNSSDSDMALWRYNP